MSTLVGLATLIDEGLLDVNAALQAAKEEEEG